MEIKPIKKLKLAQIASWGHNGYVSNQIYEVESTFEEGKISFALQLKDLKTPHKKTWKLTADDFEDYNEVLEENYSFGAFLNNVMLGFIICEEMDWNNSLFIENILVAESQRGKGIGTQLLQHVLQLAKKKKIRMVELETQNTNVPAITFYHKQGFKMSGVNLKHYDPKDDGKEIAVFMACDIGA